MTIQTLSSVQALQPGAEMWILAAPNASNWSARIDWYLNFQISRGLVKTPKGRALPLEKLLTDIQWSLPADVELAQSPLLIAAQGRLPAAWILVPESWKDIEKLLITCRGLSCNSVRFYPPAQFQTEAFKSAALQKLFPYLQVEIVHPTER